MFRRNVARFMAVVLLLVAPGLLVLPSPATAAPVVEGVVSFADVPESSMFHKEIAWLAAEGISTGWDVEGGVREYRPLARIARDAMAAFLYRKAGSPAYTPPASSPFTDVGPGAAFYKEITWLSSQGISTGWDVGGGKREYRPLSPIARDAMAAFLFRFAKPAAYSAPAQSPFMDVATGGAFYREITWLASSGISTGWDVGDGRREYRPLNGIARDAMAAFLYRYAADKVPTNPIDPSAGTVTIAPDVEVLEATQLDSASVSAGALTLPSSEAADITPNDVLVAGVTPGTPEGLLARVVEVRRDPIGSTVATLKPATLTEAIVSTSGLLDVAGTPVSSSFTPEPDVTVTTGQPRTASPQSLAQAESTAAGEVFAQSFSLKTTVKSQIEKNELRGNGAITLESSIRASAKARMTLEKDFLQLKEASVVVTPAFSSNHSIGVGGTLEGTASVKLGVLKAVIVFPAPVPVVVTAEAEVAINLSAAGTAEIAYVTAHTVSSDVGFKYRDGSFGLVNTKPQVTGVQNNVQATASLTARLALDFDADIRFYGLAGITFGAGPYASAPIAVTIGGGRSTWDCPIEVGFEGRLGVIAGVEVMGFKLERSAETSASWRLFEANPCAGTPVVAPGTTEAPVVTRKQLIYGVVGQPYQEALTATGGVPPYSWSLGSGTLPAGLQLGSQDGFINGIPKAATSAEFTVLVKDARGATGSLALNLSVLSPDDAAAGLSGVVKTVTTSDSTWALKGDGTVWAWGQNVDGLLGTGDTVSPYISLPAQVVNLTNVTDLHLPTNSYPAVYARKSDGTLWAWGIHYSGLGNGSNYSPVPVLIAGVSSIKGLDGSSSNNLVVNGDGTVSGWGRNMYNVLGGASTSYSVPTRVPGLSNIKQVATDGLSAFAVDINGTVFSWGIDSWEVLGNGELGNYSVPTAVTGLPKIEEIVFDRYGKAVYAVAVDGTLWTWGPKAGSSTGTYNKSPVQVPGIQNVEQVISAYSAYAITKDGSLWTWGGNGSGQLGHGDYTPLTEPKRVAGLPAVRTLTTDTQHVVAVMNSGQMFWWGRGNQAVETNNYGQTSPVVINSPANVVSVTSAYARSATGHPPVYATGVDGKLWAWGQNFYYQLGNGTTVPASLPQRVGVLP